MVVGALVGCAPEPVPEPEPAVEETTPPPTPEPDPEPSPGAGPACPTDHCVSVAFGGDLLFHEGLWSPFAIPTSEAGKNFDFAPLFEGAKPYLDRSDLAICQMETPLAAPGGPYLGYPNFSTPPEVADAAKAIGFDVCTTASNHSVDMGHEGLVRTLDTLDEVGIAHTGTYRAEGERDVPLIVEANGAKVAIITSTFSVNGNYNEFDWQVDYRDEEPRVDPERAIAKATKAREMGADLVIGVQHIGEEYWSEPTGGQIELAHQLHDSGQFDFVYQHHAHSIQPFEHYDGRWILYGTGNFISESAPPAQRVNNEFLLSRIQFAEQPDGSWTTNDLAWTAATNQQNGGYKWCSVASDAPQGVCQTPEFDADVRERTRATVDSMGAAQAGAREWLITQE
ncbi:CapA family protein [Leucobacter chromiisoli]|uniref:CapA family protein n=1 Tax=Leucobacter chromiisoli TaxID=2796471 RepID=UPI0027DE3DAA|nr:CapA family protein [Leucobacter chromiisoli]